MRHFLSLSLLLFSVLATGGRATAAADPGLPLLRLPASVVSLAAPDSGRTVTPEWEQPVTAAERAALAAQFGAAPALSEAGDDLRKVAGLTDALRDSVDRARALVRMVGDEARQLDNLLDAQLNNLPLGISETIGNVRVTLAIAEARFLPTHAEVDLLLELDLPDTRQDPIFIARAIKWSRTGGFVGDVRMELLADWGIDLQSGKSRLILHRDDPFAGLGTYVDVGCDGVKDMQLDVSVLLSRDWVIPVINGALAPEVSGMAAQDPRSNSRVHANFLVRMDADSGFFAQTAIATPFVFKGKEDVVIDVGRVVVDLSDNMNAGDMYFPEGYQNVFVTEEQVDLRWRGLYVEGVHITLPEKFSENGRERLAVGAPYLIIDNSGVSTHLYADGILPLGVKTADKWAFSVDSVDLKVMHSSFQSAKLAGRINVPLLSGAADNCTSYQDADPSGRQLRPEDCLSYTALIIPDDYSFSVRNNRDYCINLWQATVVIEPNSTLELAYREEQLSASATLFGAISIDAQIGNGEVGFTMEDLSFDELVLRTQAPYFEPGVWDFPTAITARLKDFEIGFRNIHMAKDSVNENGGRNAQLYFQSYISLDGQFNLDATGAFRMLGTLHDVDGRQKWEYESFKVDAFSVYASTSAFSVGAALAFYEENPTWGTGFYGYGELTLRALGGGGLAAVAQFGTAYQSSEKYFFVDVLANLGSASIPVAPGIFLSGIGGGIYRNMSPAGDGFLDLSQDNAAFASQAEQEVTAAAASGDYLTGILGRSLSDKLYNVDLGNNFGAFLQVVLTANNPRAFSANARLELMVSDSNAWSATLEGNIRVMDVPYYGANLRIPDGIGIFTRMAYIKTNELEGFRASAEVYINVANGVILGTSSSVYTDVSDVPGSDKLKYVSTDGFAGGIYLEFSTERWYLYVGRPTTPLSVAVNIAGIGAQTFAYFCVGSEVPAIPPLPNNVAAIAGQMDMSRDFAVYENAAGLAFGAGINLPAGGKFLIFYYEIDAGGGFDINIRNYGDAVCAGDGPNGESIGVNGWYAAGQAYAYIEGSVGIEVKLLFIRKRVEILAAGVATVLQIKGPNPTSGRGRIAGYYRVLGGLVSGRFRIDAKFGDNCILAGRNGEDPFESLNIIVGVLPEDGAAAAPTSTIPEVLTTLAFGETLELNDTEYRLRLGTTTLRDLTENEEVTGNLETVDSVYSYRFVPRHYLRGDREFRFSTTLYVDKKVGNGWNEVKRQDTTITFTTEPELDYLDPDNVTYAYPYDGMVNLYQDEFEEGYIGLGRAQSNLNWGLKAVFTPAGGGSAIVVDASYDWGQKRFEYLMPTLATDRVYRLQLVQHYNGGGLGAWEPGRDGFGPPEGVKARGPAAPTPPRPSAAPVNEMKILYTSYFRTSHFLTFEEKIDATIVGGQLRKSPIIQAPPAITFSDEEGFDGAEVFMLADLEEPMIGLEVIRSQENWTPQHGIRDRYLDKTPLFIPAHYDMDSHYHDVDLTYREDAVYFAVDTAGNVMPPPVTEGNFLGQAVDPTMAGGEFVLAFPTLVETNLRMFSQRSDQFLTTMALAIVGLFESGNNQILGSDGDEIPFITCFTNKYAVQSASPENRLAVARQNFSLACGVDQAIYDIIKQPEDANRLEMRNQSFPVRFTYTLPGRRQVTTLERDLTVLPWN